MTMALYKFIILNWIEYMSSHGSCLRVMLHPHPQQPPPVSQWQAYCSSEAWFVLRCFSVMVIIKPWTWHLSQHIVVNSPCGREHVLCVHDVEINEGSRRQGVHIKHTDTQFSFRTTHLTQGAYCEQWVTFTDLVSGLEYDWWRVLEVTDTKIHCLALRVHLEEVSRFPESWTHSSQLVCLASYTAKRTAWWNCIYSQSQLVFAFGLKHSKGDCMMNLHLLLHLWLIPHAVVGHLIGVHLNAFLGCLCWDHTPLSLDLV